MTSDDDAQQAAQGDYPYLDVARPAVARFLGLTEYGVQLAGRTGLLPARPGSQGENYDAADVLALKARPFVTRAAIDRLPVASVLLVQQTVETPEEDFFRAAYGWSSRMGYSWLSSSPRAGRQAAVDSARGWWPVPSERRPHLLGIVSTVSSFVVTVAVVDRRNPVEAIHVDSRVLLRARAATRHSPTGKLLLDIFAAKRIPVRRGSSRLIP